MLDAGVKAISLSVDGATAAQHDAFRGVSGSFDANLKAMDLARRAGQSHRCRIPQLLLHAGHMRPRFVQPPNVDLNHSSCLSVAYAR
jgi:hypothetical protein